MIKKLLQIFLCIWACIWPTATYSKCEETTPTSIDFKILISWDNSSVLWNPFTIGPVSIHDFPMKALRVRHNFVRHIVVRTMPTSNQWENFAFLGLSYSHSSENWCKIIFYVCYFVLNLDLPFHGILGPFAIQVLKNPTEEENVRGEVLKKSSKNSNFLHSFAHSNAVSWLVGKVSLVLLIVHLQYIH